MFYTIVKVLQGATKLFPKNVRIKNIALVFVIVGLAGSAIYFQRQYSDLRENPNRIIQAETKALLADIGKLMVLPTDEQPVVATVNDPEQLSDQNFFNNAKIGDKVLIYAKNGKAILYDPVIKKIIDIAPLNISNDPTEPEEDGAPTPPPPAEELGSDEDEE